VFFPLGDAPNHSPTRPWVNYGLIAVNVLVYLWALSAKSADGAYVMWIHEWGFVPLAPRLETFFTSMFMHAGFAHLAGNMVFLFIFGDNVEGRLGHAGYLLAYLACGLGAVLLFWVLDPTSTTPLVGASGAIFGVEGFYWLAFPKNRVRVFTWILIIFWTWIPARWFLGFTFLWNLFLMLTTEGDAVGGGIAFPAHVGGFVFGLGLAFMLRATRPRTEPVTPRGTHGGEEAAGLLRQAGVALERGQLEQADRLLSRVVNDHLVDPLAPEGALQLGLLRARSGRPEGARHALDLAARMHPDPQRRALAAAELRRLL